MNVSDGVMAASGILTGFSAGKGKIQKIIFQDNAGHVTDEDHGKWYRQLFESSVHRRQPETGSDLALF